MTSKTILYQVDLIPSDMSQFPILFYFLYKLKQRSSGVIGRHYRPVDSDFPFEGMWLEVGDGWYLGYHFLVKSTEWSIINAAFWLVELTTRLYVIAY